MFEHDRPGQPLTLFRIMLQQLRSFRLDRFPIRLERPLHSTGDECGASVVSVAMPVRRVHIGVIAFSQWGIS
jgi:hypothetical protein